MRAVGTIEARMGSSRLPGKTMETIYDGMPLLECVVQRFRACNTLDDVVVATTVEQRDDEIESWCNKNGVPVFRGSEGNVLERVIGAAKLFNADIIVQMGADSAYLDYQLIDQLVEYYQNGDFDYVCNDLKLTYPLGVYGHVVSVKKLEELTMRGDLRDDDYSDVVRFFWEHPEFYTIQNIEAPLDLYDPNLRLTIDYPEDLEQARNIYAYFKDCLFTTLQVIQLKRDKPELFEKTCNLVQESAPFLSK